MKIETSRFGTIEIDEEKLITFPSGIPGFPNEKRYALLPAREDLPLFWLQNIENPNLAFLATEPFQYGLNYHFEIPESAEQELKIEKEDDLLILVFLTFRRESDTTDPAVTANLLGPVVINSTARIGKQILLDPSRYPVRFDMTPFFSRSPEQKGEKADARI